MPFHKFVSREWEQGQINSGKLSTYQPGVKQIAREGQEKKHENDTKKRAAVAPASPPAGQIYEGHCLLSSNRKGASIVGFLDNIWGVELRVLDGFQM